jgi:hypothetical protein
MTKKTASAREKYFQMEPCSLRIHLGGGGLILQVNDDILGLQFVANVPPFFVR